MYSKIGVKDVTRQQASEILTSPQRCPHPPRSYMCGIVMEQANGGVWGWVPRPSRVPEAPGRARHLGTHRPKLQRHTPQNPSPQGNARTPAQGRHTLGTKSPGPNPDPPNGSPAAWPVTHVHHRRTPQEQCKRLLETALGTPKPRPGGGHSSQHPDPPDTPLQAPPESATMPYRTHPTAPHSR
ncbi:acidic proline-rich protein PRP25-like [Fundulus heteroclitus]|uniref:acidic proline-rich protein PRP25-like n=1 Tax=Fundulus heteroclitus TaxID=8078 RepID=UPI00165A7363|nr:acidic proline-rich protein PRP25-like [Fundulus heteroclitus]